MSDPGIQTAVTTNLGTNLNTAPNYDIATPGQWAQSQLEYMGFPATQNNIDFLVSWAAMEGGNWNNTAQFNPLNTTLRVPGSTVMSGGNTAGVQAYTSWQQGLEATAQTLAGYPAILAALKAGNAMDVNRSGGMGNDLSKWSGGGYTQIGQNTGYQSLTGGTQSANTANSTTPNIPGLNDIPALDAYIRQNFGTDSWLLDIPDVKTVLEQAVAQGYDASQIQARIMQTDWWKTTSQAVKNFEQESANNPADYNFATPGSTAAQTLATVYSEAATDGVSLNASEAQTLATNYLKYGWTAQQLKAAIGSQATYTSAQSTNAGTVAQQLQSVAGQYYMNPTPSALQSWVQGVAGGTQTVQQFQAYMAQQAALKWTGYADQLQRGYTMAQLTDNLRTDAAKTMEVDPNSIDFVNNPMYSKILDFVPPNSPNGVHRVMTSSEMDAYLKSTQPYGFTQNARDQAASIEQTLAQTWGRTGQ